MENKTQRAELIDDMMKSITQAYADSYTQLFPCSAVYIYALRKKVFKGDKIALQGDTIINSELPTHVITALNGTLAGNYLKMTVQDLNNQEIKTIDI